MDPEIEVVKVHRRAGEGTFPRAAELSREHAQVLTTLLLPVSLELRELFAD